MVRLGRIPEAEVERLKKEVDLAGLVQSKGVELRPHGRDLIGHCPFHPDRTPSLVVSREKNLWNCLGACGVGGSVIDWVMKCEGVSFKHALELLRARDAKILLTPGMRNQNTIPKLPSPVDFDADDEALLKQVTGYYHERLMATPAAIDYLKSRGVFSEEAAKKFRLGFADRTLGLTLPHNNRKDGEKIRSSLVRLGLYRESGHEHFNGSVVFPVLGANGEVREIYGRKITPRLRPGTPMHTYLPGEHRGVWNRDALKSPEVILCEAIIDALTFWVNGFTNVTASYGVNGFTEDHLAAFIENGVRRVLIAYDRDEAGDQAAEKLAKRLQSEGIECKRVLFPKTMDANSYAMKMRPAGAALQVCLTGAIPMDGKAKVTPPKTETAPMPRESAILEEKPFIPLAAAVPVPEITSDATPIAETPSEPTEKIESPAHKQSIEIYRELTKDEPEAHEKPAEKTRSDVPTEIRGEDILIRLGEREYRVRGLTKNLSYEMMKVNVRAAVDLKYHVDTLDLYQAKARTAFISQASRELNVKDEIIKRDIGRVLYRLEELQDEEIKRALSKESKEKPPELNEDERREALSLLKSPDLVGRILSDFVALGVIGEETNKLASYVAIISRKLDDPLAVMIQSSSAAGKTSLMDAVLSLVPREDKVKYSAMTGQSLFYMGEKDLKHKILAIAEEEGAKQASYALKLLQSEGEISIASTGKDAVTGKLVTHQYRVEGPVMIFLTTTAIEIDEELLNRCMVLTVNETREQTRAIHELQRRSQTLEGLLARQHREKLIQAHQNAQRMLRPLLVVNPYADRLTFLDSRTRTRRDHMKYLTLIRTIALLHQYQRKVFTAEKSGKAFEYIEVTPRDIELANQICHQVLGRSMDELPPQTRRMLVLTQELVGHECERQKILQKDFRFTRRDVRAHTGWTDFQVQMHMQKLTEMEYVLPHRGGRGQSFVYELLFDGGRGSSEPRLMGLIDPRSLKQPETEPLMQSFEHGEGQIEHPNSPQVVSKLIAKKESEATEDKGKEARAGAEILSFSENAQAGISTGGGRT